MITCVLPFNYPLKNQKAELSSEEKRQLREWDCEVQPSTMMPGDFVDNNGITTITFRAGNSAPVIDWYQRRCDFISSIKSSRNISVAVIKTEWNCIHCRARACKEYTRVNGEYHNPNGPAVIKKCMRCGLNIQKWYDSGSILRFESDIPKPHAK